MTGPTPTSGAMRNPALKAGEPVAGEMPQMQWYSGRFALNIRIDAPLPEDEYFEAHAHVFDDEGHELVVVNGDGSARHGATGRLDPADAKLLTLLGYALPDDLNII